MYMLQVVHVSGMLWFLVPTGLYSRTLARRGSAFHNSRVQSSDSNPSTPAEPYLPPAFVSQVVLANSADFQVEGQASLPQSHSRDLMLSESWLFQYPCDHVVLEFKPACLLFLSAMGTLHGGGTKGHSGGLKLKTKPFRVDVLASIHPTMSRDLEGRTRKMVRQEGP